MELGVNSKFLNATPLPSRRFEGYEKLFYRSPAIPWNFLIFSATVHLTRKRLIFPGRLFKTHHLKKKTLKREGRKFKNPIRGGCPKNEKNSKLTYRLQAFMNHNIDHSHELFDCILILNCQGHLFYWVGFYLQVFINQT